MMIIPSKAIFTYRTHSLKMPIDNYFFIVTQTSQHGSIHKIAAYEILSDAKRRSKYDKFGFDGISEEGGRGRSPDDILSLFFGGGKICCFYQARS